jgi:hypothetical protein
MGETTNEGHRNVLDKDIIREKRRKRTVDFKMEIEKMEC